MNNNRRYNMKRGARKLDHHLSQTFVALEFSDSLEEVYNNRNVESQPSIIIAGDDFIFDYSADESKESFENTINLLKLKGGGETFDVGNGQYYNPINGIEADFGGTYTVSEFLSNDKVKVSPVSGITWDLNQKVYKKNFFDKKMFITASLPVANTGSNQIINRLGYESSESFSKLGTVPGDFLKISAGTGGIETSKLFEVLDYSIDKDGSEILLVDRPVPSVNLAGELVNITLFKPQKKDTQVKFTGNICFYAKETLFNAEKYEYIERGSLVECKTGSETQARIESVNNNFNYIFTDEIEGLETEKFNADLCETCPEIYEDDAQNIIENEQKQTKLEQLTDALNSVASDPTYSSLGNEYSSGLRTQLRNSKNLQFENVYDYQRYQEQLVRSFSSDVPQTKLTEIDKEFYLSYSDGSLTIDGQKNKILSLDPGKTYKFVLNNTISDNLNLSNGPFSVYGTDSNRKLTTGFYYPMFTSLPANKNIDETLKNKTAYHTHKLDEFPSDIFYMPNNSMNHGKMEQGPYPLYVPSGESSELTPRRRLSFSTTPDGTNAGGSIIYTGVQRVETSEISYVLLTVPQKPTELYYFLENAPNSGGKINIRQDKNITPRVRRIRSLAGGDPSGDWNGFERFPRIEYSMGVAGAQYGTLKWSQPSLLKDEGSKNISGPANLSTGLFGRYGVITVQAKIPRINQDQLPGFFQWSCLKDRGIYMQARTDLGGRFDLGYVRMEFDDPAGSVEMIPGKPGKWRIPIASNAGWVFDGSSYVYTFRINVIFPYGEEPPIGISKWGITFAETEVFDESNTFAGGDEYCGPSGFIRALGYVIHSGFPEGTVTNLWRYGNPPDDAYSMNTSLSVRREWQFGGREVEPITPDTSEARSTFAPPRAPAPAAPPARTSAPSRSRPMTGGGGGGYGGY